MMTRLQHAESAGTMPPGAITYTGFHVILNYIDLPVWQPMSR